MTRHALTQPIGTVAQSTAWVTTDSMRDQMLANVLASDTAGAITRPSGEPRRLEQSSQSGGWSNRQGKAFRMLRRLWDDAKIERVAPQGYPSEVCQPYSPAGEDTYSPEDIAKATAAYRQYRKAMQDVSDRCSPRHAYYLTNAVHGGANDMDAGYLVREALSWLADEWRVK